MRSVTYHGEVDIDYVARVASDSSEVLVVGFPGPGGNNRFQANNPDGYGYIMTVGKYNANSLFINADPEYCKSWLTCVNRDFKIERTIKALIDEYASKTGSKRIIAIGSSMGGVCALYYGLKFDYDIIAGAPPYAYVHPLGEDFTYAAGGNTASDKAWFNALLPTVIAEAGKRGYGKQVFMTWGSGDECWNDKEHAPRLLADLDSAGIKYHYHILNYRHHSSISMTFPVILQNRLEYFLGMTNNENFDIEEQDAKQKAHRFVLNTYEKLLPVLDACAGTEPTVFPRAGGVPFFVLGVHRASDLYPAVSEDARFTNHWYSLRRMFFLIDFHLASREKPARWVCDAEIRDEIVSCLKDCCSYELVSILNKNLQYWRALGLLHAALYFRRNVTCFNALLDAGVAIINEISRLYLDRNGVCLVGEVKGTHWIYCRLREVVDFLDANDIPPSPPVSAIRRKYRIVEKMASHLIRPDGIMPAIGHTVYEKPWGIERAGGNFIKPESNIALLNDADDLAYITVNGSKTTIGNIRHCDALSFTFWYDGRQIIRDTGGGTGVLSDFARSAAAHTALFCDDIDYMPPDWFDWTSIDAVVERDGYVLIGMSHTLIKGVAQRRKLLWIEPNVIILLDEAVAETERKFTQNFILGDFSARTRDKTRVVVHAGADCTLTILQAGDGDFELLSFTGTRNVDDTENYRGSLVEGWNGLRKGLNLAYVKRGKAVRFLTALEAHSGRKQEARVENVTAEAGAITVRLADRTIEVA